MKHIRRLLTGEIIRNDVPDILAAWKIPANTAEIRTGHSEIIGNNIDVSTTIFPPFYTNFGRHVTLNKHICINLTGSFIDMEGITIDDDAPTVPKVNIITENHPVVTSQRKYLSLKPVVIKRNAWIGATAIVLPGIMVRENAIV